MSTQGNLRQCKNCKELIMRIPDGKYTDSKDKRWVDPEGGLWNGNSCPQCTRQRVKVKMREKRAKPSA
jgi:hypothetical protein